MKFIANYIALFIILFSAGSLYAGKAIVLPEGVFNFNVAYKYSYADSGYDDNGKKLSLPDWTYDIAAQKLKEAGYDPNLFIGKATEKARTYIHKLDYTLAYGITNQISALILFPTFFGYLRDQSLSAKMPLKDLEIACSKKEFSSEIGDISFGIQHLIIGTITSPFRFAYSVGFRSPTGHVADPMSPTDDSTGNGQWVALFWLDFDYEFSKYLYLNLHTETEYQFKGTKQAKPFGVDAKYDMEFQPGLKNTIELEPHFIVPTGKAKILIDSPMTWTIQGKTKMQKFNTSENQYSGDMEKVSRTNIMTFFVMPTLGVELFELNLPLRLYAGYQIPLAGKNVNAVYTFLLRVETYWKF